MPDVVAEMLTNRRIERVAVNHNHALSVIDMAEQHIRTATALATTDDRPTAKPEDVAEALPAATAIVQACAIFVQGRS